MPLKFKYPTKQEIPAEQQTFYVERDGAWLLDADGVVEKSKLDEFRQTNLAQTEQYRKSEAALRAATERLNEVTAEKERLELQAKGLKPDEVEKAVAARLKTELEKVHAPVLAERDALNARLSAIQIDQAVVAEATKRGLRPTALADITARARSSFKLVNGVPQIFDGDAARMGRDGASPMTLAEWVEELTASAPHLFEANAGSGAAGSSSGGAGNRSAKNPFRKESWNLTEQMQLQKSDPKLAQRLKAAA